MTCAEIFTDIYARGVWGAGSGGGSDEELCWPYQRLVERLIRQSKPQRVLDIGCSDGRVAAGICWQDAQYLGIDCISFKERCNSLPFQQLDALIDPLPEADLVLVKEVTQHLSNTYIATLLGRLKQYPVVLHCSAMSHTFAFSGIINREIETGGSRAVNLSLYPFGLSVQDILEWRVNNARYLCQLWRPQ